MRFFLLDKTNQFRLLSLVGVALTCGFLWRLEIEYYGWAGLYWLSYFHIALPIGFGIFVAWANTFVELPIYQRLLLNLVAIMVAIGLYFALTASLYISYSRGPSGMVLTMLTSESVVGYYRISIFILISMIPVSTYLLLRIFRNKVSITYLLVSLSLYVIAIPLSLFLIETTGHKGSPDFIHAIKSGIIISFWVFATGWIIIGIPKQKE